MRCPHCGSRISDAVAGEAKACPVCQKGLDRVVVIEDDGAKKEPGPVQPPPGEQEPARKRVPGATAKFEADDDPPEAVPLEAVKTPPKTTPEEGPQSSGAKTVGSPSGAPPPGMPASFGPFQARRKIGEGGMGAVFEGYDPQLDRRVAIKVLASRLAKNQEFVQRFLAEARAIARVAHPNVASVFFAGSEGSEHFFAMEFIEGESLDDRVEKTGALTPKAAIGYVTQAVRGLAAAHERGIVHRDVKPANLMLDTSDKIKVTDFGLAKSSGEDLKLTQAGAVMGSPHFMAPEQGRGENTDFRADVYSLGATFYYLVTGKPPYEGDSSLAVILKHQEAPVPQIERAPPSLNRLFGRMMAKAPADRYPSYSKLMEDLVRLDRSGLLRDEVLRPAGMAAPGAVASPSGPGLPAGKTPVATPEGPRGPGLRPSAIPTQKADDEAVLLSKIDAVMKKRPGESGLAPPRRTSPKVVVGGPLAGEAPDSLTAEGDETTGVEAGYEKYALSPTLRYALIAGGVFLVIVVLSLKPWSWFGGEPASPGEDPKTLAALQKLRPLLADSSAGTRQTAVRGIGRHRGPTAERMLLDSLSDGSEDVRAEAARALVNFGGDQVVRSVHRLLADASPDVRETAARCLESMTGYEFPESVSWRTGSAPLLKAEAADFLKWWRSR